MAPRAARLWLYVFIVSTVVVFRAKAITDVDPTLLKPDSHETIVDEKEDSNPSKKSLAEKHDNSISYNFANYRTANRPVDTVSQKLEPSGGSVNKYLSKNAVQSKAAQNEAMQSNTATTNNEPFAKQNNVGSSTINGAGSHTNIDSTNGGVNKALAFYESIVANAKKVAKENRGMKQEGDVEKVKNYAVGIGRETSSTVCESPECKTVAEYVKSSMNETVNPCQDFYEFACGGWKGRNQIPESENEITAFTKLTKKIENATHFLLTQPSQPGESDALTKARKFYYSCMDKEKIEKKGPKPALDFLESIGGWSMCGNKEWNEDKWDVYDVLKKVQSRYYPAPPFFTVEVTNDHLNSTKHLIKVSKWYSKHLKGVQGSFV